MSKLFDASHTILFSSMYLVGVRVKFCSLILPPYLPAAVVLVSLLENGSLPFFHDIEAIGSAVPVLHNITSLSLPFAFASILPDKYIFSGGTEK